LKLSEVIKEIEDIGGIDDFYLHRDEIDGSLELNIIFKNKIADEKLYASNIRESDNIAHWE